MAVTLTKDTPPAYTKSVLEELLGKLLEYVDDPLMENIRQTDGNLANRLVEWYRWNRHE